MNICKICNEPLNIDIFKPCDCEHYYHENCFREKNNKRELIIDRTCNKCNRPFRIDFVSKIHRYLFIIFSKYQNLYFPILAIIYFVSLLSIISHWQYFLRIIGIYNVLLWTMVLINSIILAMDDYKIWTFWILSMVLVVIDFIFSNLTVFYLLVFPIHLLLRNSKQYIYYFSAEYWYVEIKSIHNYCL